MSEKNGNSLAGYGKDPLETSHGDALLDQNFQSLKSKEVRDSMSPTHELKFHSMSLSQPNTTGWDVQTSSEVSPDGRAYRTETLAKTDGVEKLNGGGTAEFKGRNEQRSSASHQGDDKNYVKKAAESSNTQLQEKVVFGDESSGRTEMKTSSTTSSSTSKFVSSSSTTEFDEDSAKPRYLMDNQASNRQQQQREQRETREQHEREQRLQEQRFQEHRLQQQQREERHSESREQSNSTRNVETQQHYEENKRYVDMDKASPEYQRHVQHLMSQPGEIISNTVEYPKPNVKMITTVKRLPDGTIVKNKRYETEQLQPAEESTRQTQTQNNQRRAQDVQHTTQTQTQTQNQTNKRAEPRDVVDNVETVRRPMEAEELLKQENYSSVKKSSRRYSTETTSETVEEYDDRGQHQPSPAVPRQDFSTHGFPSVKANKPTQEFPNKRPSTPQSPRQPTSDFSTHGFPSVRAHKPTQEFANQRPSVAGGEEVIVVKSEQSRNVKQSSSSQRTTETEYVSDDHAPLAPFLDTPKRTGTPSWEQPASPRRPNVEDFSTHGFPSVRPRADQPDGDHVQHTSRTHSATHKSNTERIIETQVEQDGDLEPEQQQRRRPQPLNAQPPASPRRTQPREDYGTQGFPSARSPTRSTPDASTRRSPLSKSPTRKPTHPAGRSSTNSTETTTTTLTRRQLQKEREVDASHRAFAASLRSSSPAESTGSTGSHHHRRESGHSEHHQPQRQTPRSSISSNRTYRRDAREGSHDSHAPSESSRISSSTVTRHVHGVPTTKSVGKTLVTKQQQQHHTVVKNRNVQASNETIDLMPQRSPKSPKSPTTPTTPAGTTKTTTTTTTTIISGGGDTKTAPTAPLTPTTTPKAPSTPSPTIASTVPAAVPVASSNNEAPTTVSDNQSQYTYATTKPADIFSLPPTPPPTNTNNNNNEPTLTTNKNNNQNNNESESNTETITKTKLSTNDATVAGTAPGTPAVNEPPCVRRNYYKLGPSDKEVPNAEPADIIATAVTSSETVGKA